MEREDEIAGLGNSYTAMFWQYDSRTGRRWNLDPRPNSSISSYGTFALNPVMYSDVMGDTTFVYGDSAQVFVDNLNSQTQNVTFGLNGDVMTANITQGATLLEWEQKIVDAIKDNVVNVNIIADSFVNVAEDDMGRTDFVLGGQFGGSIMNPNGNTREAFQFINEGTIRNATNGNVLAEGVIEVHELLEAYIGAKDFTGTRGTFVPNSTTMSAEFSFAHAGAIALFPEADGVAIQPIHTNLNVATGTWTFTFSKTTTDANNNSTTQSAVVRTVVWSDVFNGSLDIRPWTKNSTMLNILNGASR